jgi:hypothetical protein
MDRAGGRVELERVSLYPLAGGNEAEIEAPSWSDLAGLLRRVDGVDSDQRYLEARRSDISIQIGVYGGSGGVVMHIFDGSETYYPTDPA